MMLIHSNSRGLGHFRNPCFIGINLSAPERTFEEAIASLPQGIHPDLHPMLDNFISVLHKCRENRDPSQVMHLQICVIHMGLENHTLLGNHMVAIFFLELAEMRNAQQVFDKMMPHQDEFMWNSLIKGYVKHGEPQNALLLHLKMKKYTSLHPNAHSFIALLKACTVLNDPESGSRIHAEMAELELEKNDAFIGSALVHMYAKCGFLEKAQDVFDNLTCRDVVSWNALLSGYSEHGQGDEALLCFQEMKNACISPNSVTYVCCLMACGNIGVAEKVQEIYGEIMKKGLEKEVIVGNTLIDTYAKLGFLTTAQKVLDKLLIRDVVSWTSLVAGYAEHNYTDEVHHCLRQMQEEGISLNLVTFVCVLKSCAKTGDIEEGREVHDNIIKRGLEREVLISNTLIDVYAKCGALKEAKSLFDHLLVQDEVAWTALIAGYVEQGYGEQALQCVENMQLKGIPWNSFTFVCSLKACSIIGATVKGCEIHMQVVCSGYEMDLLISNMLIDMYAKCGLLAMAEEVFEKLPVRNVVSWTTLMTGFLEHGYAEKGFNFLEQMMQDERMPLNVVTYLCSLKMCGSLGAEAKGQEIHLEVLKKGLEGEVYIGSSLVDMYAKCNYLTEAQEVFNGLLTPTIVAWNALIGGYVEHGHCAEALNILRRMRKEGVSPDALTLACSLKACGKTGTDEGHAEIVKKGFERELLVGNVLVDIYAKCGLLEEAQQVFDELLVQDIVSWNALIAGHAEHGCSEDILCYIKEMQQKGILFNVVTFISSMKACGNIGGLDTGYEVHCACTKRGLERELPISNALIDMYAKCGLLPNARMIFDGLEGRDGISWNALVAGYAQIGESENVFQVLFKMLEEGFNPDSVTFISLLNACSHAGLIDKGQIFFDLIGHSGLMPSLDHYTCIVDLLGRAGHIEKAIATIMRMPFCPGIVQWHTVLAACRKWGDVDQGRHAFEHALCLDEKNSSSYVYMSNICADLPMQMETNMHEVMAI